MKKYIEHEAVNALIKAECSPKVAAYLIDAVATIPAADVRPVIRGEWIKQEPYNQNYWKCSNCGETNKYAYRDGDVTIYELQDFFCPNCGADMRGGGERCG